MMEMMGRTLLPCRASVENYRQHLPLFRSERLSMCIAGNNVGDNVLLTPAFKGTVPTGLLIAADMMVSSHHQSGIQCSIPTSLACPTALSASPCRDSVLIVGLTQAF